MFAANQHGVFKELTSSIKQIHIFVEECEYEPTVCNSVPEHELLVNCLLLLEKGLRL